MTKHKTTAHHSDEHIDPDAAPSHEVTSPAPHLTVKELADLIRDHVDPHYSQKVHPDDQHLHATAVEVCKELEMEPNALNVNHVSGLINQHVGAPSRQYPKMKYHHDKKLEIVVDDAKAEAELGGDWVDNRWPVTV